MRFRILGRRDLIIGKKMLEGILEKSKWIKYTICSDMRKIIVIKNVKSCIKNCTQILKFDS